MSLSVSTKFGVIPFNAIASLFFGISRSAKPRSTPYVVFCVVKCVVLSFPGKAPSLLLPESAGESSESRDLTDKRRKSGDSCGGGCGEGAGCGEGPDKDWCMSSEPTDDAAGVGGIRAVPFDGLDD